jgi:hypothetical protein
VLSVRPSCMDLDDGLLRRFADNLGWLAKADWHDDVSPLTHVGVIFDAFRQGRACHRVSGRE